jgi:hypothetical protein
VYLRKFTEDHTMRRLLRDKQLREKLGLSKSELSRRRRSDPDFPPSFLSGPAMRVTEESDADGYIEVLKRRALGAIPNSRPRGRPRKDLSAQARP